MSNLDFPTQVVKLPFQGKLYPKESPLSSGQVELKYMTAKQEDILTNLSYIEDGTVIDRMLQSLIVDKTIDIKDLFIGDKNKLVIAARILGYGKEYEVSFNKETYTIDLSKLEDKPLHSEFEKATINRFQFTLPECGKTITFKFLNGHDETEIQEEVKNLQKVLKPEDISESEIKLARQIVAVDGDESLKTVRNFIQKQFRIKDVRAFRKYANDIQPDVDLIYKEIDGLEGGVRIPMGISFFWPDLGL